MTVNSRTSIEWWVVMLSNQCIVNLKIIILTVNSQSMMNDKISNKLKDTLTNITNQSTGNEATGDRCRSTWTVNSSFLSSRLFGIKVLTIKNELHQFAS